MREWVDKNINEWVTHNEWAHINNPIIDKIKITAIQNIWKCTLCILGNIYIYICMYFLRVVKQPKTSPIFVYFSYRIFKAPKIYTYLIQGAQCVLESIWFYYSYSFAPRKQAISSFWHHILPRRLHCHEWKNPSKMES